MSVRVTIEHGDGNFRRQLTIHRTETRGEGYDARHLYEVTQWGGRRAATTNFEHRYGDPLSVLVTEALAAISTHPDADKSIHESQGDPGNAEA